MDPDGIAAARARMREQAEAMGQPLSAAQLADREVRAGAVKLMRQMAAMDAMERQLFRTAREQLDKAKAAANPGTTRPLRDDSGRDLE